MPQGMFCVHTRLARRLAGFSCVEVRRRFNEFPEKLPRPLRERGSIPPNCVNKQDGHPVNLGGRLVCWWSRRESNPRPQALYRPLYILSFHYLILTFHTPMGGLVESESP